MNKKIEKRLEKILILKNNGPSESGMGLDFERSFRSFGCEVFVINLFKEYLQIGAASLVSKLNNLKLENSINLLLYEFDPLFHLSLDEFRLINKSTYSVIYMGDDEHYFYRAGRYYGQVFDLILTPNYLSQFSYHLYGINAIFFKPFFMLDVDYKNNNWSERSIKISFIGAKYGKIGRAEYIDNILLADFPLEVYGSGSENGVITDRRVQEVLNNSKISLNFTGVSRKTFLDSNRNINQRIRSPKGRCQQIALNGSMVLTEYSPGIEYLFDIGSEIIVFEGSEDLHNKIKYYLENDDECKRIARNGHIRALKDYSSNSGVSALLRDIAINSKKTSLFKLNKLSIIDKDFKKLYSTYHLALLIKCISKINIRGMKNEIFIVLKYPIIDFKIFLYYVWSMLNKNTRDYIKAIFK